MTLHERAKKLVNELTTFQNPTMRGHENRITSALQEVRDEALEESNFTLKKLTIAINALEYVAWPGFDRDHWDRVNSAQEALKTIFEMEMHK